jgi:hypothetical protein
MIELVKKATVLEAELKQALDDFSKDRKTSATLDGPAIPHLTPLSVHSAYLTELYASSALTYLHVVVSGAYPELPEIRENVLITLELLKKLPSPLLPRAMWWSLLITGSMVALGDEESFCRNIIKSCGINDSSLGCGYNILKTLEECWRRRQMNDAVSPLGNGYWGDVMSVYSQFCLPLSECFTSHHSYGAFRHGCLENCGTRSPLSLGDMTFKAFAFKLSVGILRFTNQVILTPRSSGPAST